MTDLIRAWVLRRYVAVAALRTLADEGALVASRVEAAIARCGIDARGANPWDC